MSHKYRFGVKGNPLKSFFAARKLREKRTFPESYQDTWDYVSKYFELNRYFVESNYG
jgi:hypothetical protein